MRRHSWACVTATALLAVFALRNAGAAELGLYVGVNGASTTKQGPRLDDSNADAIYALFSDSTLQFGPFVERVSGTSNTDNKDTVYGFVGGWRWRPNIAFELGYMDLGETKFRSRDSINVTYLVADSSTPPQLVPITTPDTGTTSLRAGTTGIALSALGIWPVSYRFELYGRAGVLLASNRLTLGVGTGQFGGTSASDSRSSTDFLAGVGGSLSFLDIYQARLEFVRVFGAGDGRYVPNEDVDMISLGFTVTF